MSGRRFPRPSEVLPLIGTPDLSRTMRQRRLDRCASIWDLRALAHRRAPRVVFDYTDGAAMSETSLRRSRAAFSRVELTPRVLRDVSDPDPGVDLLGRRSTLPIALAPTGFTRMMNHAGEPAVARVAADVGVPYALSTLGTTGIEDLAAASPDTRRWFQLYVNRDRGLAEDLMRRASAAGYDTLILTVDAAVGGIRRREVRGGLTIPPQLSVSTMAEMALHPRWWLDAVTTTPLTFANLSTTGGTVGDLLTRVFDPTMTWDDLAWVRGCWPGPIMLKGIQSLDDARMAADRGVEAIVLSNHGGRQVDLGGAPLELLPSVAAAVGDTVEVYVDGGVMSGADVVAAVAFGARGVLVGRAYLYGLMAGGEDGVRRATEILAKEVVTTMQLIGARSVDEVREATVRLR